MVTNKKENKKEKERLIRFSVRVSPKAAKAIGDLQRGSGESLSTVLRDVIYEGLKATKSK